MNHSSTFARPAVSAIAVVAILLSLVFLSACQTVTGHLKSESFDRAVKNYERAMRWGNYPVVLSMHKAPDDLNAPIPLPEDYTDYKISGYDIVYAPVIIGENNAHQTIKISYVDLPTQRLYSVNDRQQWEYDLVDKRWMVASPFALPAKPSLQ